MVASLPARADAEPDAYAARTDADPDARAAVVVAIVIISAPFDVAFARRIIVGILDDDAAITLPPASPGFVTDHADVFDAVVGHHSDAVRQRSRRRRGGEQRSGAERKRDNDLVHADLLLGLQPIQLTALPNVPRRSR